MSSDSGSWPDGPVKSTAELIRETFDRCPHCGTYCVKIRQHFCSGGPAEQRVTFAEEVAARDRGDPSEPVLVKTLKARRAYHRRDCLPAAYGGDLEVHGCPMLVRSLDPLAEDRGGQNRTRPWITTWRGQAKRCGMYPCRHCWPEYRDSAQVDGDGDGSEVQIDG